MIPTELTIIPKPVKLIMNSGSFALNSDTIMVIEPNLENIAYYFCDSIEKKIPIQFKKDNSKYANSIRLFLDDSLSGLGTEGYILQIIPEYIEIKGSTPSGVFYGIQTLLQLVLNISRESIPCLEIEDYPRFSWRGYMLDEGRYFFGMDYVKHMLDAMAFFKMNLFHWHLTEDLGWRIEIKKYPRLTAVGSKRKDSQIGGWLSKNRSGVPHEGFYTQEQIKEILQYAKNRFITIVPEIDIPGHSMAALASYPEYSCAGGPFEVPETVGIKKEVYCPGKEKTFEFLENILDEVIELFQGKYIHIGGDEVPRDRWKSCPDCNMRMANEHIPNIEDLQVYFTNRIIQYLNSKGIQSIGWNEIINSNLNKDAIVEWWKWGIKTITKDLKLGRKFIICKSRWLYFDLDHSLTPTKKVYCYNPIPNKYKQNIMGMEVALWSEWISDINIADWMTFPRLLAFAENTWTSTNKRNYKEFAHRMESFIPWMEKHCKKYMKQNLWNPNYLKRLFDLRYLVIGNTYEKYNK
jgi:hexosaminidase